MSQELNNVTPARQMSGRRSKPSMELLIDNQRILSQYIVPKKNTLKQHSDNISVSNTSTVSSISFKEKARPKSQKAKLLVKSREENISPKIVYKKRKLSSPNVNGSKDVSQEKEKILENHTTISRSPYNSSKLKKIDIIDYTSSPEGDGSVNKEDDDLPLSKVFPDFKPRVPEVITVSSDKRSTPLVLPPKKKIKFVNINELNGFQMTPKPLPTSSPIPIVSDILSLPKIPKKKKAVTAVSAPPRIHNGTQERIPDKDVDRNSAAVTNSGVTVVDKTASVEAPPAAEGSPAPPNETHIQTVAPRRCIRQMCTNVAIDDLRWEREFCSPDCAVLHTKNVFVEWLQQKRECV